MYIIIYTDALAVLLVHVGLAPVARLERWNGRIEGGDWQVECQCTMGE